MLKLQDQIISCSIIISICEKEVGRKYNKMVLVWVGYGAMVLFLILMYFYKIYNERNM